ncbi:DUF2927 domain-containing protein [Neomegalonema sp.]|uniref:DUF2927 domain-containing protein n=1 Tax=Neomegalonema sp. TaxID=2039713 RepID=UPI00260C82F1|nr:DUF2927 domain-containing protein [Neomegalonema sp.]MDD2869075.1 DUF2927 domain-containing protein [Neomegalonema sp.]
MSRPRSRLRAALSPVLAALVLSSCGAVESGLIGGASTTPTPYAVTAQSPAVFGAPRPGVIPLAASAVQASPLAPGTPRRANVGMARDFVDLTFRNEGGEARALLARWEGPARVRLAAEFAAEAPFLDAYLAELAAITGLEIRRAGALEPSEIRIRAVRPSRFAEAAPGVLCGSQHAGDWRSLSAFRGGIVDIPADSSPARRRICLIEEIAQLLGPVNDLERAPDSIFNDDGAHVALTPFDRLILRTLYAPEIQPGMSPEAARAGALAAMARLNPAGIHGGAPSAPESAAWSSAYRAALAAHGRDAPGFASAMARLEAAAAALPSGDHRRMKTLTTRAAAALARGDAAAAARDAEQARALARAVGDEAREAEALGLKARASRASGDPASASALAAEARAAAVRLQRWDLEESLAEPPAPVAPARLAGGSPAGRR